MTIPNLSARGRTVAAFLVGTILTLAVLTLVLYMTQASTTRSPASAPPPEEPPSATATTPSLGAEPSAGEEEDQDAAGDDQASWKPIVIGFAKHFPAAPKHAGITASRWRAGLRPFVTQAVADQLTDVDLAKMPRGHYASYEVLTPGSYQIAVKVTYREAWALVLYVTSDGRQWRVSAYDRWAD